ncbi:MAG TPA: biosynthetic peptidoglycan transglycosylase [Solirubrobacteraceae bacterium]
MSDDLQTLVGDEELLRPAPRVPPPAPPRGPEPPQRPERPRRRLRFWRRKPRRRKPRLRKLRFLGVLVGVGVLALISTAFGMMMGLTAKIPQIENQQVFSIHDRGNTSYLVDDRGRPIGVFAPPTNQVIIPHLRQISGYMQNAVVAVEDQRFWSEPGVDIKGIARALIADIIGGGHQGASTITEQLVKNHLQKQNNRTILEKMKEAALAYHLSRKWSKDKILREYLNTVYFGNGAYGVESAARVYFGPQLGYVPTASSGQNVYSPGSGTIPRCVDFYY